MQEIINFNFQKYNNRQTYTDNTSNYIYEHRQEKMQLNI